MPDMRICQEANSYIIWYGKFRTNKGILSCQRDGTATFLDIKTYQASNYRVHALMMLHFSTGLIVQWELINWEFGMKNNLFFSQFVVYDSGS